MQTEVDATRARLFAIEQGRAAQAERTAQQELSARRDAQRREKEKCDRPIAMPSQLASSRATPILVALAVKSAPVWQDQSYASSPGA
jgi:hypothetical protein